ncbi:MAG TPA: hypothetical protein VND22_02570 [Actinomycetota bacterium]|nr:hypothetical protein [Actinomycetota bacterium]
MPDAKRSLRARAWKSKALVVVLFLVAAFIHTAPAITDCNQTIMGGPGDATSGGVWTNWQHDELRSGPWPTVSPYINAPFGEPIWRPLSVSSALIQFPMWAANLFLTPVCSWNVIVFLGFVATGLTMFGLAKWLTGSTAAALFAGYVYAFSPYHVYKAEGHIGYLHSEILVLTIWAALLLWKKPGYRTGALLGLAIGAAFYIDGYYLLMAPVGAGALLVSLYLWDVARGRVDRKTAVQSGISILTAGGVAAALSVPLLLLYMGNKGDIASSLDRPRGDLITYSARPHEFVLPPRSHPVFSPLIGDWQDRRLHYSNYSEQSLYLGWTVILLSGFAVVSLSKSLMTGRPASGEKGDRTLVSPGVAAGLAATAAVAIAFTAPPTVSLFGIPVPALSGLIFDHVAGFWRVYARFFLLAHTALVPLAAIGLTLWLRKKQPRQALIIASLVMAVGAFEILTLPPWNAWSYSEAPPEYRWLSAQKNVDTVAEYPLATPPAGEAFEYLTFQVVHEKRLINSGTNLSPQQGLRQGIRGLGDPQTPEVLRSLGVDIVLLHDTELSMPGVAQPPPEMTIVKRFPSSKTIALRITDGPAATHGVSLENGFHDFEPREWESFRWMSSTGKMKLVPFSSEGPATISFQAFSFLIPRTLTVRQGGDTLWTGEIQPIQTPVSFSASSSGPIILTTSPGPSSTEADQRPKSIGISELDVGPG